MTQKQVDNLTAPFKIITPIALILLSSFIGTTGWLASNYMKQIIDRMDMMSVDFKSFGKETAAEIRNIDGRVKVLEFKVDKIK